MEGIDITETTHTARPKGIGTRVVASGDLVDRFTVLSELGSGGMGRVYEALDPDLQRHVALKVLHDARSDCHRQRLVREAQALAQLGHPNVVAVHEVGDHADALFIVMELVGGGTLKDWVAAHPPGGTERQAQALGLLAQAGRGLIAAHGEGLVHRDVKPSNILVGTDGRARVADFGIVRSLTEATIESDATHAGLSQLLTLFTDTNSETLTRSGVSLGTPAYMAPEQFSDAEVGKAADQFSFCVSAWEVLFGVRPFRGRTIEDLVRNIGRGRPAGADDSVPESLVRVLRQGLSLRPRARNRSLQVLVDELEAAGHRREPARRVLRWRVLAGLGTAALMSVAVAYHAREPAQVETHPSVDAESAEYGWLSDTAVRGATTTAEADLSGEAIHVRLQNDCNEDIQVVAFANSSVAAPPPNAPQYRLVAGALIDINVDANTTFYKYSERGHLKTKLKDGESAVFIGDGCNTVRTGPIVDSSASKGPGPAGNTQLSPSVVENAVWRQLATAAVDDAPEVYVLCSAPRCLAKIVGPPLSFDVLARVAIEVSESTGVRYGVERLTLSVARPSPAPAIHAAFASFFPHGTPESNANDDVQQALDSFKADLGIYTQQTARRRPL